MRRVIYTYLREAEYQQFMEAFKNSLYPKKSQYARNLLLGKPPKIIYRNRSLDDFTEMGIGLRKDLKKLFSTQMLSPSEKQELAKKITSLEENLIKLIDACKHK